MSNPATLTIALPPDLEEFVSSEVSSGRYPTPGEVVRQGLRLLKEWEQPWQARLDELQRKIEVGQEQIHAGRVRDGEEFFEELEEELRRASAGDAC